MCVEMEAAELYMFARQRALTMSRGPLPMLVDSGTIWGPASILRVSVGVASLGLASLGLASLGLASPLRLSSSMGFDRLTRSGPSKDKFSN